MTLIEAYEEEHHSIPDASPVEVLRTLMDANDLRQKDLVPVFGSESIVSEVLHKKRELNKTHIEKLSKRFGVSPRCFLKQKAAGLKPGATGSGRGGVGLVHVVVHGEDFVEAVFVGVDVDHPAEDDGMEAAAGVGAGIFAWRWSRAGRTWSSRRCGVDRAAACRDWCAGATWRRLGDAGVELVFRGALGHGVHGADELVAGGGFFVEQGSRARGIEREGFQKAVAIAREVIFGLREIRQKDFEAVVERDVVVLVFFDAGAKLRDDFVGALQRLREFAWRIDVMNMCWLCAS